MKYLRLALQVAKAGKTKRKNHHLGVIAKRKDGSIITACNTPAESKSPNAHAESKALRQAGYGCKELYVTRIMANGDYGLAKPCFTCRQLIIKSGVKKVIYSVDANTISVWYPLKEKI